MLMSGNFKLDFTKIINQLRPNSKWSISGKTINDIIFLDGTNSITEEEFNQKVNEQKLVFALKEMRVIRDELLSKSDWTQNRDVILTNDEEWKAYRQALRDLPETQTPALDDNGNLINVEWPTPPGETSVS